MPEERSIIEGFTSHAGSSLLYLFDIRPVVLDTSFLVQDVRRAAISGQDTPFLHSIRFGSLRGFSGTHVWAEVPRVLSKMATAEVSEELLAAVWWDHYVPRLRFVDLVGLPVPQWEAIAGRDVSDAPTLALAQLLHPVVVLAADRDIRDLGFGGDNWWALVENAGTMTTIAEGGWAGMVSLNVLIYMTAGIAKGAVRLAREPVVRVAVGMATLLALLTLQDWAPVVRGRAAELRRDAGTFLGERLGPWFNEVGALHKAASQAFDQAAFIADETGLVQRVARLLATTPHALTRTEIAEALLPQDTGSARRQIVQDLGPLCNSTMGIVQTDGHRWQLGRSGVDFGGRSGTLVALAPRRPTLATARATPTDSKRAP